MSYSLPPYRVGIAGAGAFAAFLAGALAMLPEFQLTAVAGRTDEKRQRVLTAYRQRQSDVASPREYREATELIRDPDIDVVILSTPPHLHASLSKLALMQGKHVLLEKPGALTSAALKDNAHLATKQRRAFAVNLVLRYNPLVEAVEWMIRHRLLGRVYHASLHNAAHRVTSGHWFWNRNQSGGIFIEHGVHFFEVGRHWFGEPEDVRGFAITEASGEQSRVWASVIHRNGTHVQETQLPKKESASNSLDEYVPVQYYHGFTMEEDAPESTRWEVHCAQGRIVLEGWIPQRLYIEGMLTEEQAKQIDALLDIVPTQPRADAGEQVRAWAAARLSSVLYTPERTSSSLVSRLTYQRTLSLPDRQGWYEAMAQARFLDLCRMIQDPNWNGLVTLDDAVADLALAESCTVSETWQEG
ncbi:Gfo/Idh/MocA family protein [Parageobacillus thermoglucosidasius]|uniref:Gfo/Idh/MocA family protein n=1 Tax=Parageobacillus thermoglucosidasius TaxID=1426 RepID=UPI000E1A8400|nr:Gfo/Idh/MocA family oxidoreductase [Parageobacillus thermoglucosidasius]RDE27112.1 gfo/Idh/MocA family oxidoreductase [Parageobacillus thermoglucosidasius]